MKPYSKNLCRELSATPVMGPVVAGDSTTAKKGRRYLLHSIGNIGEIKSGNLRTDVMLQF